MLSNSSKKIIESELKNVEVVPDKLKADQSNSNQTPTLPIDQLKEKFLATETNPNMDMLKEKFLGTSLEADLVSLSPDHTEPSDDSDIEVGRIKKKSSEADGDQAAERTVIFSKKNRGLLGSQG